MTEANNNRRAFQRIPANAVVGIDTRDRSDRGAITRNVSSGGLFFHSMNRFLLGERITITYRDRATDTDTRVTARVVRVASDVPSTGSSFPHLCAIEFDHPIDIAT
jgi:hypothetical protein